MIFREEQLLMGLVKLLVLVACIVLAGARNVDHKPVKSIQSPDGDIIDCIILENQVAFAHPILRGSSVESTPEHFPEGHYLESRAGASQLWQANGNCPDGTISVRRHDASRAAALYGRKFHKSGYHHRNKNHSVPAAGGATSHEHAIAFVEGGRFFGARANINVWNPKVQGDDEFSLSQIWILGGSFDGSIGNSIEAGWQVFPGMYGDQRPRLFIYWTSDSYQATGCYNLLCPGFVQTSNQVVIGGAIAPSSSSDGSQYDINLLIWKDPKTGNWWLQYGDNLVGYWPAFLFTELAVSGGSTVEWGGEVVNTRPEGEHTSTMMGSGLYAEAGFARASYFRDLRVVNYANSLEVPTGIRTYAARPNCYDIKSGMDKSWGSFFFYGGPGRNALCN